MTSVRQQAKKWIGGRSPTTQARVSRAVTGIRQAPMIRHYRRWRIAHSYLRSGSESARRWIFQRSEESNFLYDITPRCRRDLAAMLAAFMNAEPNDVQLLFQEIDSSSPLENFRQGRRELEVHPGRREAWYAITRLSTPRTVVETGVADGLGALVLLSALAKNSLEGRPGRYVGIDIVDGAGRWAREWLGPQDVIVHGESTSGPEFLDPPIDLLILDSDHDPKYEARELEVLGPLLSPRGIVISDNCHVSDALREYSQRNGRSFMIWREEPLDHWYPGASLGLSLPAGWTQAWALAQA